MAADVVRARVAHHVPGRLRLRLEPGADAGQAASRIEVALAGRPGCYRAEPRPGARSVIVHYNPAQLELQHLLDEGLPAASIELLTEGFEAIGKSTNGTRVGQRIVSSVSSVNGGISRATAGTLDLRDIFPLTLFGFGLRRLAQGNLQPIPWYNLLYYGYSMFYSLHARKPTATPETEPDAHEVLRRRFARGELTEREYERMRVVLESGQDRPAIGRAAWEERPGGEPK